VLNQDLASRARAGKLKLEEFQGGSFTYVTQLLFLLVLCIFSALHY